MNGEKQEVDARRGSRAGTTLSLRAVAAGYLIYLGWTMVRDLLNGSSTLPVWLSWTAGIGFAAVGAAFGWYSWKRYQADMKAERTQEEEKSPGEDEESDRKDEIQG